METVISPRNFYFPLRMGYARAAMRTSAAQSHLRFPLTRLLGNGGHVRVLRALMAYGAPLGASQLAADSGLTPQGTRLVLDSLVAQGLVGVLGQARSQLFTVVPQHPMAAALQALFQHEQARWSELQDALRSTLEADRQVRSAWLYGSVARGEDEPRSDVDLALVMSRASPQSVEAVRESLRALGDRHFVHFCVVALAPADVAKLPPDDRWWSALSRDARVLKGLSPQAEAARCTRAARRP